MVPPYRPTEANAHGFFGLTINGEGVAGDDADAGGAHLCVGGRAYPSFARSNQMLKLIGSLL